MIYTIRIKQRILWFVTNSQIWKLLLAKRNRGVLYNRLLLLEISEDKGQILRVSYYAVES